MEAEVCRLLSTLIGFETVNPPGNEEKLAKWLAGYLWKRGFLVHMQSVADGRANVIADIGSADGPLLLFNGHLDVVPPSGNWTHGPFSGLIEDRKIWGRGTVDMKGGVAAMVEAACMVADERVPLHGGLRLVFVADEECRNRGIRCYLEEHAKQKPRTCLAVIGEPTELDICRGHKGVERYWVEAEGLSAHSGKPEQGRNAIVLAARLIPVFERYHRLLAKRKSFVGSPSCAVTMIGGGEKENTIPSRCRFLLDRRTIPGETSEQVGTELQNIVKDTVQNDERFVHLDHFFGLPPALMPKDAEFVETCRSVETEVLGKDTVRGFGAGCEQGFLLSEGIETVVCGPGALEQAHCPDENLGIDELTKAVRFYRALIHRVLE